MDTKESNNILLKKKSKIMQNKAVWIVIACLLVALIAFLFALVLPGKIKSTKNGIVFSKFGVLSKNKWIKQGEKTYYFDKKGHAYTGLHEIEKEFYFFGQDGKMHKGWLEDDSYKYYFQEKDGKQVRGAANIDQVNYYFSKKNGALQTGVIKENDQLIAYADDDGKLQTGVLEVEGKKYCFNEQGLLQTGWVTVDGVKSYCFDDFTVATGKQNIEGKNYYFNDQAQLQIGWCENNGEKYYASKDGSLVTGRQTIDDKDYFFTDDGVLQIGWINVSDDERYYAMEDGSLLTGQQKIFNTDYTFDETGKLVAQTTMERKMVALTFDDGPSVNTDRILNVLQQYNCRATFFVVGSRIASYPSQLKRVYDLGCEIGSHTFNHKYLTRLSPEEMQSEIDQTNAAVAQITGQNTTCIRPPGGFYNEDVLQRANSPFILWNIDTMDWKTRDPQQIIPIATTNIQDGDIILMHDLYSTTADSVEQIVPALLSQGFEIVTVSELLDAHGGIFNGKVYFSTRKIK